MDGRSYKPFARALGDLLREQQADPIGRVSLYQFLSRVPGKWGYQSLRMMINGERTLQPEAIEAMAAALDVDPRYFREYRHYLLDRMFESRPEMIDEIWDTCSAYMEALDESSEQAKVTDQKAPNSRRRKKGGKLNKDESGA